MEFEWDENKELFNIENHEGINFTDAEQVFEDDKAIENYDESHSYCEDRYTLLGLDKTGQLLLVIFCERGEKIRIISAWKAKKKEDITAYFQKL